MKNKVVLIGLDEQGARHFSELRRSEYFELCAVCDKNKNDDLGRIPLFNNIQSACEMAKPDAIIIVSAQKKREALIECAKFCKNILIHAPFALNLEEARTLKYTAQTNKIRLFLGYETRFNPVILSLQKELMKDKKIYSIKLSCGIANTQENNGVNLTNLAIRNFDLLMQFIKSDITSLKYEKTLLNSGKIESLSYLIKSKNGILSNINICTKFPKDLWSIEICTNSGLYIGNLSDFELYKITSNGRVNLKVEKDDLSLRMLHCEFSKVLQNGNFDSTSAEKAVKIWEILQ